MGRSSTLENFLAIEFGAASAEREWTVAPHLLADGYAETLDTTAVFEDERRFLVLGRKGTGKSALGFHLALSAGADPTRFVRVLSLPELPLGELLPFSVEEDVSLQRARWVLLTLFLASLADDESANARRGVTELIELFRSRGLLSPASLKRLSRSESTKTISDPIRGVVQVTWSPRTDDIVSGVRGTLLAEEFVTTLQASGDLSSFHYVVIDGLDELPSHRRETRVRIAQMIRAAASVNRTMARARLPLLAVVLCRSDLFARLPLAEKNKLRQDESVELEWYDRFGLARPSQLSAIIDRRAWLSLGRDVDVAAEYLSFPVRGSTASRVLSRYTRATPRDLTRLLVALQDAATRSMRMNPSTVASAIESYSTDYFVREIRDHLESALPNEIVDDGLRLLGGYMRRRGSSTIGAADLVSFALSQWTPRESVDVRTFLRRLYDAGGIGEARGPHTAYAYTKPAEIGLDLDGDLRVHPGLRGAL